MSSSMDQIKFETILIEPSKVTVKGVDYPSSLANIGEVIKKALLNISPVPCRVIIDDFIAPSYLIEPVNDLPTDTESRLAFFNWRYEQLSTSKDRKKVVANTLNEKGWILTGMSTKLIEDIDECLTTLGFSVLSISPRWSSIANQLFASCEEVPSCLVCLSPTRQDCYRGSLLGWHDSINLFRQWSEDSNLQALTQERIYPTLAFLERIWGQKPKLYTYGSPESWRINDYSPILLNKNIYTGAMHVS